MLACTCVCVVFISVTRAFCFVHQWLGESLACTIVPPSRCECVSQSKVFTVPSPTTGQLQYVWLGNAWVTSTLPGRPRNHDLLYWTLLAFDDGGMVKQVQWNATAVIDV